MKPSLEHRPLRKTLVEMVVVVDEESNFDNSVSHSMGKSREFLRMDTAMPARSEIPPNSSTNSSGLINGQ